MPAPPLQSEPAMVSDARDHGLDERQLAMRMSHPDAVSTCGSSVNRARRWLPCAGAGLRHSGTRRCACPSSCATPRRAPRRSGRRRRPRAGWCPDGVRVARGVAGQSPVQHRGDRVPRQRPRRLQRGVDRVLRPRARRSARRALSGRRSSTSCAAGWPTLHPPPAGRPAASPAKPGARSGASRRRCEQIDFASARRARHLHADHGRPARADAVAAARRHAHAARQTMVTYSLIDGVPHKTAFTSGGRRASASTSAAPS